jgi:predicted  nucleic acid-binding Zn-ribbon protein
VVQSSVKETLKKLVILQKIDVDLFDYRRQLREIPSQLHEIQAVFDKKKARLHQLETKAQEQERLKKAKELDLKSKEADMVKADGVLMTLKTNKEYQAKLFEIENLKADKSILEDEILKTMEEMDKINQEVAAEKTVLAEEEKKYLAEKAKVDAAIAAIQDQAQAFETKRREAMQGIDKEPLALYERIVENRDGLALVPIAGNACGGCFMSTPPQVVNKIRMYDELVRCERCARLLYLQEEME